MPDYFDRETTKSAKSTIPAAHALTLFGNVGATQINRFGRAFGSYPNGGPDRAPQDYPDSDYGITFHQVITYHSGLREWHWYRNGVLMEVIPDHAGPTTIRDVNVWLGRSEFSNNNNFQAGPDKLNLASPAAVFTWTAAESSSSGSEPWSSGANGSGVIATFATALVGDQEIMLDSPVTLGALHLGARGHHGSFTLPSNGSGAITWIPGAVSARRSTSFPAALEISSTRLSFCARTLRSPTLQPVP